MKTEFTQWQDIQLYAGIDLHKNKWVVTVRTDSCYINTFVCLPDEYKLLKTLQNKWHAAKIKAVYEAGCFGYHLADYLNSNGIDTIIVAPHTIPTARGSFVKTDKIDSRKLASELSKGSLKSIYMRSTEELCNRSLVRKRIQLVKRKRQIICRLKSDIIFYNVKFDFAVRQYLSKKVIKKIRGFEFSNDFLSYHFNQSLDEYEIVSKNLIKINLLLEKVASSPLYNNNFELLRSVPGIGKLTASIILLEIGNIERFSSKEKFVSYLGLTPTEFSSGDKVRIGSLSGMGHNYLRSLLIECSWQAVKFDPVLMKKYYSLSEKKGKLKAIVAIAKKLATRIHYVLKTSQPYVVGVVR
jgi:transposase